MGDNQLEGLPADVGWLPLRALNVEGNPRLRIPKVVLKQGFRCAQRMGPGGG